MDQPDKCVGKLVNMKFTVKQLEIMLKFLDAISAACMTSRDQHYFTRTIPEPERDFAMKISKLVDYTNLIRTVFLIRRYFNLSMDCVQNAIFVQKMLKLNQFVKKVSSSTSEIDLGLIQHVCHLMRDCERATYATLSFLAKQNQEEQALFFALFMKVSWRNWPEVLKRSTTEEAIREQTKKVKHV